MQRFMRGVVTRVEGDDVYVEVPDIAEDYELGPVARLVPASGLPVGARVLCSTVADADDVVVMGRLMG